MTAGEGGTLATCSKLLLPVAEQQGKEPTVVPAVTARERWSA